MLKISKHAKQTIVIHDLTMLMRPSRKRGKASLLPFMRLPCPSFAAAHLN
jgi:hypothetical protein